MPTKKELIVELERERQESKRMDKEISSLKEILADYMSRPDTSRNLRVI